MFATANGYPRGLKTALAVILCLALVSILVVANVHTSGISGSVIFSQNGHSYHGIELDEEVLVFVIAIFLFTGVLSCLMWVEQLSAGPIYFSPQLPPPKK